MRSFWAMSTMLAALFTVGGSVVEAAQKGRFCATQGEGQPNCSYRTAEQCRTANQGEGRCVPKEWLEKKPANRVARAKPANTVEFDRHAVSDIYFGPLGRYGTQDVPQMYNYDSGPNRHSAASWIGNGNGW
jgi:hypothetical protein